MSGPEAENVFSLHVKIKKLENALSPKPYVAAFKEKNTFRVEFDAQPNAPNRIIVQWKTKKLAFLWVEKTEISRKREVIEKDMHLTFCWKFDEECIAVSPMALSEFVLKI